MIQSFHGKLFESVKQKEFYPYDYMNIFEKFKKGCLKETNSIVYWLVKELVVKTMNMFLKFGKGCDGS